MNNLLMECSLDNPIYRVICTKVFSKYFCNWLTTQSFIVFRNISVIKSLILQSWRQNTGPIVAFTDSDLTGIFCNTSFKFIEKIREQFDVEVLDIIVAKDWSQNPFGWKKVDRYMRWDISGQIHQVCYDSRAISDLIRNLNFQEREIIRFYERNEPYYALTNFYYSTPFQLDGQKWRTAVHFYQANKFSTNSNAYSTIKGAYYAREAFEVGKRESIGLLGCWDCPVCDSYGTLPPWFNPSVHPWSVITVKEVVMVRALLAKFFQNKKALLLLLSTRNAELVEHTKNDSF